MVVRNIFSSWNKKAYFHTLKMSYDREYFCVGKIREFFSLKKWLPRHNVKAPPLSPLTMTLFFRLKMTRAWGILDTGYRYPRSGGCLYYYMCKRERTGFHRYPASKREKYFWEPGRVIAIPQRPKWGLGFGISNHISKAGKAGNWPPF